MKLYEKIKRQRKAKGLSQAQVGVLCGVSKQMIQKYESGIAIPTLQRLIALAKVLDFSVNSVELIKNLDVSKKEDK